MYTAHVLAEVLLLKHRPPVKCYVDNKSLVEALHSTKSVEDKHLRIDVAVLRDMMQRKDISEVSWIQAAKQLANPLTKAGASTRELLAAVQH